MNFIAAAAVALEEVDFIERIKFMGANCGGFQGEMSLQAANKSHFSVHSL